MKFFSNSLSNIRNLSKRLFYKIAKLVNPKLALKDKAWVNFWNSGGEQLRYVYPALNPNSIVFDLGGYEGGWASDIYSRYKPGIYIFEVYTPYFNNIRERFNGNSDIKIYNFGLSSKDTTLQISIDENATSALKKSKNMVEIELKSASDFIKSNNISKIDLMKINIEGGEYELMEHLISSGVVKIIENIQIQFHDFVPNSLAQMTSIREKLSASHYSTYQFDFIWDNWKLK